VARIRTIKPKFWTNEDLSALPEATHLLAGGLINYADDNGYFNANPGLIKAECSPLREPSVSIPESLKLLVGIGYLRLGTGPGGKRYGQIVTFDEHQRVNRPTPSTIKGLFIAWDDSLPAHAQLSESSLQEGKGREGKGEELVTYGDSSSDAHAPDDTRPGPAEPEGESETGDDHGLPACPHSAIVALYHETLPALTRVREWTPKRRSALRARWRESRERQDLSWWREFFAYVGGSDFLMGRAKGRNGQAPFECDLEWLVKSENFTKVIEGKYENRGRP
jgi:hypothetical protein